MSFGLLLYLNHLNPFCVITNLQKFCIDSVETEGGTVTMVSDFRKKKYLHAFNTFLDKNLNGTIDKNDFLVAMGNIAEMRGYKPGEFTYQFMEEMLDVVWDGLAKAADSDSDGTINTEEWVTLWDQYSQNPEKAADWYKLYAKAIFQLIDLKSDGAIDEEEFVKFYDNFSLDKDAMLESFKKASNGNETITWSDFESLFKDYFTSDDVAAPGNFIFGEIN